MANGELEIQGFEKLNQLVIEFKGNLEAVLGVMTNDIKATEASNKAKLDEAKTLQILNKTAIEQRKAEEQSALNKLKVEKATLALVKATEAQNKAAKDEAIFNDKNAGTLEKLEASNRLLAAERKTLNLETVAGQMRLKEINAQLDINNDKIRENSDSLKQQKINIGNYASGTASLREQMKFLTMELVKMKMAGEEDSATYKEMVQKLGDLKDSMADVAAEAKVMGSDTKSIDMFVGSIKAVGSAGQVAESTMQLLGSENEDVTKGIQRMMAIQTMMNGVQEIGNSLQKESAFMLGLNAAGTKLAAAGQAIYTFAVGASTGALKAFRIAMLATGIGALIAGLALLVVNFDKVKKAIFGGNDELERFGRLSEKYNLVADIKNKKIKDEIELLKAKGATDDEIEKKEREMMLNGIAATEAKIAENKKLQESAKGDQLLGLKNQENALNNSLREQDRLLLVFDETNKTRRAKELEEEKKKNKKKDEIQKESIKITRQNTKSDYEIRLENQKEGEKLMQEQKDEVEQQKAEALQETYDEELTKLNDQYLLKSELARGDAAVLEAIEQEHKDKLLALEIAHQQLILGAYAEGSTQYKAALKALQDLQVKSNQETNQKTIEDDKKAQEEKKKLADQYAQIYSNLSQNLGQEYAKMLESGKVSGKEFLKATIKTALDSLKALAYIYIAKITGQELASKGFPIGLITAGVATVALEAAIGAAKYGVSQFAKGTKDAPGGPTILGEGTGIYAGRELVTLPDGTKFLTPDHATLYPDLPKHSVVTPANMVEQELRKSFENSQLSKNDNRFMSDVILRDMNKNLKMLTKKNTAVHIHGMNVGFIDMVNKRYRS